MENKQREGIGVTKNIYQQAVCKIFILEDPWWHKYDLWKTTKNHLGNRTAVLWIVWAW